MDALLIFLSVAFWIGFLWLRFGLPRRRAVLASRAYQSRCDYALGDERGCYRARVNATARVEAGDSGFDIGQCRNCAGHAPRWVTKAEVADRDRRIAEGWTKPDGRPCD